MKRYDQESSWKFMTLHRAVFSSSMTNSTAYIGRATLQHFLTSSRNNTVNLRTIFQYRALLNMAQSLCSAYITAARGNCTVPFIRKIIRYCGTLALLRDITCKVTVRWRRRNNYKGRAVKARIKEHAGPYTASSVLGVSVQSLGQKDCCQWTKHNFTDTSCLYTTAGDQARKQKVLKHIQSTVVAEAVPSHASYSCTFPPE